MNRWQDFVRWLSERYCIWTVWNAKTIDAAVLQGGIEERCGLMTQQQRQTLIEKNHNLIYAFLKHMRLPADDYYDLAAIGLCRAADTYAEEVLTTFSTYAFRCMYHEAISYWRKEEKRLETVSLDIPEIKEALESRVDTATQLPETEDDYSEEIWKALQKLSALERVILSLWVDGYNCREITGKIAKEYPYSLSYIQKKRKHAVDVLQKELSWHKKGRNL